MSAPHGFAYPCSDEVPDAEPWLVCMACDQLVADHPPAVAGHRRRHRAKPLRRRSPMLSPSERDVRQSVFERDGFTCQLRGVPGAGDCYGPLTPHHRRKASQGGPCTAANLATLCRHHNDQLEARADIAALGATLGLVVRYSRP